MEHRCKLLLCSRADTLRSSQTGTKSSPPQKDNKRPIALGFLNRFAPVERADMRGPAAFTYCALGNARTSRTYCSVMGNRPYSKKSVARQMLAAMFHRRLLERLRFFYTRLLFVA